MDDNDYQALSTFIRKRSGIVLGDNKAYLVESRLGSLAAQHGYTSVGALAGGIANAPADVAEAVVDAMTTNESFFFRDMTPFKHFEEIMLPALARARRGSGALRIWCAAASTGQEPYSLAMILSAKKHLWAGLNVEIVATDLSDVALGRAREGRYTQFEVQRGLPVTMLVEHFRQEGTNWIVSDKIRQMVRLSKLNLLDSLMSVGRVDIVFCRNVLIYFDVPTKTRVLDAIHAQLRPDGYLVLGAAETMLGVSGKYERASDQRGLYQPVSAMREAGTA